MGMNNRKLTINDTIARLKNKLAAQPHLKLVPHIECQDIAEAAKLKPVPVQEETLVQWYYVSHLVKAMEVIEEQQRYFNQAPQFELADPSQPTPVNPDQEAAEISLIEAGAMRDPEVIHAAIIDSYQQAAEAAAAEQAPDLPNADADEPDPADTPDTAESFESIGIDPKTSQMLIDSGVETPEMLRNLVKASGFQSLTRLDGIGEARANAIRQALESSTPAAV